MRCASPECVSPVECDAKPVSAQRDTKTEGKPRQRPATCDGLGQFQHRLRTRAELLILQAAGACFCSSDSQAAFTLPFSLPSNKAAIRWSFRSRVSVAVHPVSGPFTGLL